MSDPVWRTGYIQFQQFSSITVSRGFMDWRSRPFICFSEIHMDDPIWWTLRLLT